MISIEALAQRDNWICHLCHQPVPKDVARRSKLRATRDHVIPRSLGGPDVAENLKLAHKSCNQRRGNRKVKANKKTDWKLEMERRRNERETIFNRIRGVA